MSGTMIAGVIPDFWLDASTITGVGRGDPLLGWHDVSGNGGVALPVGTLLNLDHLGADYAPYHGVFPNSPPTYAGPSEEIGGESYVSFDSARRQSMKLSVRDLGLDTSVRGFSFVTVARFHASEDASYLFITHGRTNSTRFAVIVNSGGRVRVNVRPNSAYPDQVFNAHADRGLSLGSWAVLSVVVDYRRETFGIWIYLNSEGIGSFQPGDDPAHRPAEGGTSSDLSTQIVIGSTGENNHLSCDIAELLCFREDINLGEPNVLRLVESELRARYGIP